MATKMTTKATTKMTNITGDTRLYAILADPIGHVKAPQSLNRLFEERGMNAVMIPMHVDAQHLHLAVAGLRALRNLDGFVVTVPHKSAIVALCDELTPAAARVGAVNVVRRSLDGRLHGDILDGRGFVAGLMTQGIDPAGMSVYLAGAGGAANAIAFALAEAGVRRLTIANRTRAKALGLVDRIAACYPDLMLAAGTDDPSGHDLVVNATSLGLRPEDSTPCDVGRLDPTQIVAEIIMQPAETALLTAAKAKGCRIHFGAPMLACQIDMMAAFMNGANAEPDRIGEDGK